MKISVLIPTFQRPEYLAKALNGLRRQNRAADEVIIGVRSGDSATLAFLERANYGLPLHQVEVSIPGVIASMKAALERSTGDIVCLLDDDAEPLDDWLACIEARFKEDNQLGGLGGRDLLQDEPEMRAVEPTTKRVGVFTWYGRLFGNHHRGAGSYRRVDILKGCNCAFRGAILREISFETRLRGEGAQVHWELALCLDVARSGYRIAYDPDIRVIHHIAPRKGLDQIHRGGFSPDALFDMVFNEHLVVMSRTTQKKRIAHLLWTLVVGSLVAPGIIQFVRLVMRRDASALTRLGVTLNGVRAARQFCTGRV